MHNSASTDEVTIMRLVVCICNWAGIDTDRELLPIPAARQGSKVWEGASTIPGERSSLGARAMWLGTLWREPNGGVRWEVEGSPHEALGARESVAAGKRGIAFNFLNSVILSDSPMLFEASAVDFASPGALCEDRTAKRRNAALLASSLTINSFASHCAIRLKSPTGPAHLLPQSLASKRCVP